MNHILDHVSRCAHKLQNLPQALNGEHHLSGNIAIKISNRKCLVQIQINLKTHRRFLAQSNRSKARSIDALLGMALKGCSPLSFCPTLILRGNAIALNGDSSSVHLQLNKMVA